MQKWIGKIDVGYGPTGIVIEADTEEEAREQLYQWWLEECENNCDRQLHPYTADMAEYLSLED